MKALHAGVGAVLALVAGSAASAAHLGSTISNTGMNRNATQTFDHTVDVGNNEVLIVGLGFRSGINRDVTSVSWKADGYSAQSLTVVSGASASVDSGTDHTETEIWYIYGATQGSGVVTVNFDGALTGTSTTAGGIFSAANVYGVTADITSNFSSASLTKSNSQTVLSSDNAVVYSIAAQSSPVGSTQWAFSNDPDATYQQTIFTLNNVGSINAAGQYTINGNDSEGMHGYVVSNGPADASMPLSIVSFAVPEPTTLSLLAVGATGLLLRRRKNK